MPKTEESELPAFPFQVLLQANLAPLLQYAQRFYKEVVVSDE
jgi:hypothetical protein